MILTAGAQGKWAALKVIFLASWSPNLGGLQLRFDCIMVIVLRRPPPHLSPSKLPMAVARFEALNEALPRLRHYSK